MGERKSVDVLIVGSGPAGISTALHLMQIEPAWAARIVIIEKAEHPREKLCGGGVTQLGEQVLSDLGLSLEPAHIPVREMRLIGRHRIVAIHDARAPVFRIVRRDEFDHWLVRCGEKQRLLVRQGEAVTQVVPRDDAFDVHTDQTIFQAKMVVAADGSNSTVGRKLKLPRKAGKARTLEVLTPETGQAAAFEQGIAEYDFTSSFDGLQGYCWNFPCMIQGKPFMSRGIFDSRVRPKRPRLHLKHVLRQKLADEGKRLDDYELRGFPIQWFDTHGIVALPRLLFVGDAAGVDPFFGEGISFALAYGAVAAQEIARAFASQNFSCSGYQKRILAHPILKKLRTRVTVAHTLYTLSRFPWLAGKLWDITPFMIRMLARCHPEALPFTQPRIYNI